VRDALLDIAAAQKQVEVAGSSVAAGKLRRSARHSKRYANGRGAIIWQSARPSNPWPRPTINT